MVSNATTRGGGLSLYANLLDPSTSATSTTPASVSRGPVVFKPGSVERSIGDEGKRQQPNTAALRFQPTKRPQLPSQKPKTKHAFPKAVPQERLGVISEPKQAAPPPSKNTLADWAAAGDEDDVNGFYGGEKRQRGGRKRRKKNVRDEPTILQDWDDIYDPSRPNNYDEYRRSEEKVREVREWKDRLYAHRMARRKSSDADSEDDEAGRPPIRNQFAPPPSYSFAPPPLESSAVDAIQPPNKSPAADLPDDVTGDDAYARRLKLSGMAQPSETASQALPQETREVAATSTISKAPVRYDLPPPPTELPASEAELQEALEGDDAEDEGAAPAEKDGDATRSRRPGQKGFAERLMSKYGWSKGTGLGASGTGMVNALQVKVEKRKKKPDSEGGGFVEPGNRGKIFGGKKSQAGKEAEVGKFGIMSEVVLLRGMVEGLDLESEIAGDGDGGIMQEIGDECGEKYGRVERVYIDRSSGDSANVFVKFTSQLSALRAVNALEGRIFNGNAIKASFYDTEAFDKGEFDL